MRYSMKSICEKLICVGVLIITDISGQVADPVVPSSVNVLSQETQQYSDRLFLDVLQYILSAFTASFSDKQSYIASIKRSFDTNIRVDSTTVRLIGDARFHKKNELRRFVRQLTDMVVKYGKTIPEHFQELRTVVVPLLRACLFQPEQVPAVLAEILLVNIAIADKKKNDISRLDQIDSDKAAKRILKQWLHEAYTEMQTDGYKIDKRFSTDYIERLLQMLNLLRMQPAFAREYEIYSGAKLQDATLIRDPIAQKQAIPLMHLLRIHDSTLYKQSRLLYGALRNQLFFNPEEMEGAFSSDDHTFRAIVEDKRARLQQVKKSFDMVDYLRTQLKSIKQIADLRNVINQLAEKVDGNEMLQQIQKELQSIQPDVDYIMSSLQHLAGPAYDAFQESVRNVLNAYRASQEKAAQVIRIIQESREEFKKKGVYSGARLIEKLDAVLREKNISLSVAMQRSLKGLFRTADTVRNVLSSLVGGPQVLDQHITREELRAWIEPYGLLCLLLKDYLHESKDLSISDRMTMLYELLHALNTGRVKGQALYPERVKTERALIASGIYKGKLDPLIQALDHDHINNFLRELESLIARGGFVDFIRTDTVPNYQDFMMTLQQNLKRLFLETLLAQITELNRATGLYEIPGIPVQQTQLYRNMRGMFDGLLQLLQQIDDVSERTVREDVQREVNKLKEAFQTRMTSFLKKEKEKGYAQAFAVFMNTMIEKLNQLTTPYEMLK